jgi:hypothetical protein
MAAEVQIGGTATDRVFLDTDGTRSFHVKDIDTDSTGATAKNITGWTILLDIRRAHSSASALLTATCSISGSFNSVAASNTQRAVWTFADTDLTTTIFGTKGGTFKYSLKRTDAGAETVLQYGDIVIERATQI